MADEQFYAKDHLRNLDDILQSLTGYAMCMTRGEDQKLAHQRIDTINAVMRLLCGRTDLVELYRSVSFLLEATLERGERTVGNSDILKMLGDV